MTAALHQEVLAATGAAASVVLQRATRSGAYVMCSAAGLPDPGALRLGGDEAEALEALAGNTPRLASLARLPSVAALLGANAVMAVAIAGTRRPAYLLVNSAGGGSALDAALARARLEFGLALELERLGREAAVHERLRELFLNFSRSLSDLSPDGALDAAAREANAIFEARRTSVWLHDRQKRHLVLAARSDGIEREGLIVAAGDPLAPAARGLRLERPCILTSSAEPVLIAPLRGWRRALGTIVVEGSVASYDDEQLVAFAHELARQLAVGLESVQLVQEVLRQRERLAQSEKLASLGQFVAGIAHEMNNPLQGVLGHLELLISTSAEARPLRTQLKRIYAEADRAAKIVHNLLVFTGSRRMARHHVSMNRVLSRALTSRRAALKRARITITRRQGRDVPHVAGDPLLLQQAVLNILINAEHAIHATGRAGRIELATRHDRARKVVVTTIRDTGTGIPADALPRIFDPFFTTKDVGKGTGLGLAITYGIIQEHGGTIQAGNAAGGGAVFTIELPAAAPVVRKR